MASSTTSAAQQVEELLNFYKAATFVVGKNQEFKCNGNYIESIISPTKSSRKSKRLLNTSKYEQVKVEPDNDGEEENEKTENEEEEENEDEEEDEDEEGEEEKVQIIKDSEEVRSDIFEHYYRTIADQSPSYADEDLQQIFTQVIKVDPIGEEDTNNSVDQCREVNVEKRYSKPKQRNNQAKKQQAKKTPRVILKVVPSKEQVSVKALKQRNGQVKSPRNQTDKVTQSNIGRTHSRTRPLKDKKSAFDDENVNKVLPKNKSKSTNKVLPTIKTKSRSTTTKPQSICHSQNKEDPPDEAKKRFPCSKCDKSFQYASALKYHKVSHTNRKPYACDLCPSRYSQLSHLTRHSLTHKKNTKKFKCSTCKASFRQNYYLQVHMRTHTGAKPYECKECEKSFSQKSHLNTHLKTHKEKQFTCNVCTKTFTLPHHLASHIKSFHSSKR